MGRAIIRTRGLTKVYDGADFGPSTGSTCGPAGEIFGLLGPNGAGKTTTAGMLTTRVIPTGGRRFVGGVDVVAQPRWPNSSSASSRNRTPSTAS